MAVSLEEKLIRRSGDRRAEVETRAALLIVEEVKRREPRATPMALSRARRRQV